jgi:hypothetical protein
MHFNTLGWKHIMGGLKIVVTLYFFKGSHFWTSKCHYYEGFMKDFHNMHIMVGLNTNK